MTQSTQWNGESSRSKADLACIGVAGYRSDPLHGRLRLWLAERWSADAQRVISVPTQLSVLLVIRSAEGRSYRPQRSVHCSGRSSSCAQWRDCSPHLRLISCVKPSRHHWQPHSRPSAVQDVSVRLFYRIALRSATRQRWVLLYLFWSPSDPVICFWSFGKLVFFIVLQLCKHSAVNWLKPQSRHVYEKCEFSIFLFGRAKSYNVLQNPWKGPIRSTLVRDHHMFYMYEFNIWPLVQNCRLLRRFAWFRTCCAGPVNKIHKMPRVIDCQWCIINL